MSLSDAMSDALSDRNLFFIVSDFQVSLFRFSERPDVRISDTRIFRCSRIYAIVCFDCRRFFCFQISVLGFPVFSSFRMSESADLHRFSDFTNVYFRICWRSRERGRMCSMAKLVALIEW